MILSQIKHKILVMHHNDQEQVHYPDLCEIERSLCKRLPYWRLSGNEPTNVPFQMFAFKAMEKNKVVESNKMEKQAQDSVDSMASNFSNDPSFPVNRFTIKAIARKISNESKGCRSSCDSSFLILQFYDLFERSIFSV